jgi:hypothetical protein
MLTQKIFNQLQRSISIRFAKSVPYQYYSDNDVFIARCAITTACSFPYECSRLNFRLNDNKLQLIIRMISSGA